VIAIACQFLGHGRSFVGIGIGQARHVEAKLSDWNGKQQRRLRQQRKYIRIKLIVMIRKDALLV